MPVDGVAYREEWPAQFRLIAVDLRRARGPVTSAIVGHVGSTSVPGLAAEPVIDIDVVVERDEVQVAVSAVENPAVR